MKLMVTRPNEENTIEKSLNPLIARILFYRSKKKFFRTYLYVNESINIEAMSEKKLLLNSRD